MKVRDLNRAAQKLQETAAMRVQDYVDGVAQDTSWAPNTIAAEPAYAEGVQKALQKKAFARGVQRAGQSKYQQGVAETGGPRFAQGVSSAGSKWQQGFQPYAQALAAANLTPRGAKGSEKNAQRMMENFRVIMQATERIKGGK